MTSEELQRQIEAAPRVALAQLIEIIDSRWGATNRAHVEGVTINKARVCNFLWAARSRLIDVGGDSVTK